MLSSSLLEVECTPLSLSRVLSSSLSEVICSPHGVCCPLCLLRALDFVEMSPLRSLEPSSPQCGSYRLILQRKLVYRL